MVMSSTNAMEVNIQAVSPELILSKPISAGSVGAAGAAAAVAAVAEVASAGAAAEAAAADAVVAGASSAQTADAGIMSKPMHANRVSIVFKAKSP